MKTILVSLLLLLCSAPGVNAARNLNIPFDNVTCITSHAPAAKYTVEFLHPTTKKKTLAPVGIADYRKLMKATFDRNYTARCIFTGKNMKVTLIKKP